MRFGWYSRVDPKQFARNPSLHFLLQGHCAKQIQAILDEWADTLKSWSAILNRWILNSVLKQLVLTREGFMWGFLMYIFWRSILKTRTFVQFFRGTPSNECFFWKCYFLGWSMVSRVSRLSAIGSVLALLASAHISYMLLHVQQLRRYHFLVVSLYVLRRWARLEHQAHLTSRV